MPGDDASPDADQIAPKLRADGTYKTNLPGDGDVHDADQIAAKLPGEGTCMPTPTRSVADQVEAAVLSKVDPSLNVSIAANC